jgi:Alginate lyase
MKVSRSVACAVVVVTLLCVRSSVAESFSVVSPQALRRLPGLAGTMEGRYAISVANKNLERSPASVSRIHVEGTLPHQGIFDASIAALAELGVMRDFALAYRLTSDRRYLDQASKFIDAWISIYQLSFNPIDESGLDALMLTNDLCRDDFAPSLRTKVDAFLRSMVEGYLESIRTLKKPDTTNWQSLRVELITMGAFALGDARLISAAQVAFEAQVAANVYPGGTLEDFHQRDALHYVTYDLDPLLMAAACAHAHNMDWFHWHSPTGSNLKAAVSWLVPYAEGTEQHEEFAHSGVPFDQERMQAGVAHFSKVWDPKESLKTFGLAAAMDPQFRTVVDHLRNRPGYYVNHWIVLLLW